MLIQGDAARIPLPDKSVHCIVTSPPYWGLRKYAGEQGRGLFPNLGLEPTPQEHIEHLVEIMREVRRVLRDDGVIWLNYGDCFAGSGGENANAGLGSGDRSGLYRNNPRQTKISQGNLILMPHRVAIALQDDGWIVRNDLIWWKRNPMPESVAGWRWERTREEKNRIKEGGVQMTNLAAMDAGIKGGKDKVEWEYGDDYILRQGSWRHTRAHEYIFQLVKSMGYYCNQEAVREELSEGTNERYEYEFAPIWEDGGNEDAKGYRGDSSKDRPNSGRNPRSVLDVPTSPYSGAHYATFPPDLIAPLIRASCPRRCCPECGQAWAPVVERGNVTGIPGEGGDGYKLAKAQAAEGTNIKGRSEGWTPNHFIPANVTDYRPTCSCGHEDYVPGIVLDPFVGSGTTVMVAQQLLRRGIGLDISMEYLDEQAKVRAKISSPSNQFDELPLFENLDAS